MTDFKQQAFDMCINMALQCVDVIPNPVPILKVPPSYSDPIGNKAATASLNKDSECALINAMAYKITSDEVYAIRALSIISAWARSCKEVTGFEAWLNFSHKALLFVQAFRHIQPYVAKNSPGYYALISDWINNVYVRACNNLLSWPNNPGAWGWCGKIVAAKCLRIPMDSYCNPFLNHLQNAIDPKTGELSFENKRTNSGIWYTSFALEAYTKSMLALDENLGVSYIYMLFPAYRSLWKYCKNPSLWPYRLPAGWIGSFWRWMYPCSSELEVPSGGWPNGLFDTLSYLGLDWGQNQEEVDDFLNPQRPCCEGSAFRFSTLRYYYGIDP
jgi:hypothetical protein